MCSGITGNIGVDCVLSLFNASSVDENLKLLCLISHACLLACVCQRPLDGTLFLAMCYYFDAILKVWFESAPVE